MGIPKTIAELLIVYVKKNNLQGKILTLGKQDCLFNETTLHKIAKKHNFKLHNTKHLTGAEGQTNDLRHISDVKFFSALGFSEIISLDHSDFERANLIFDLNKPNIPTKYKNYFDVIFDGGTMEHVFHVPNMLNNLFNFLKVNGTLINVSPSSNYLDHGFYMFSPTLLYDYYTVNKYEIISSLVLKYKHNSHFDSLYYINYIPNGLNIDQNGGLDDSSYLTSFVVKKTDKTTGKKVPQQGGYVKRWSTPTTSSTQATLKYKIWTYYLKLCQLIPFSYNLYLYGYRRGKGIKNMKKL